MAVTQDFPRFLRHAMHSAGYKTVAELSRASGVGEAVINKWMNGRSQPTIELLRPLVEVIHVPLLELLVVCGRLSVQEARLKGEPTPPGPAPTYEDNIRADPYLSDDKKAALIAMINAMRSDEVEGSTARKRREA